MSLNLSNKKIEDDDNIFNEINNPEKYTSIDLSQNLLTKLPKNLSQFNNLHTLNITNNKFINYQEIATSLSTLPELKDLSIDLATQENVIIILSALPNLIKLNGQNTADTTLQQSFLSQSNLTNIFPNLNSNNNNSEYRGTNLNDKRDISLNEETNVFEYIYKQLKNEEFNKKFQAKLRNEISNINKNLDISNNLYNSIIVKSKLEIYTFILEEVLNLIPEEENYENFNNYLPSLKVYKNIINIVKDKLKENQNILFELVMSKNTNTNISKITEETKLYNNKSKEKIIPKPELITLLNEIYHYNLKQNEKNNKINLPNESFYSSFTPYLTTKYGLKSIASYWNNKIMEGINYYYENDCEIKIFKDIIEGKIKEDFYLNYMELKSSCSNIIFQALNNKYPHKSNSELKKILKEKINGFITYEEWIKLIDNLLENNNKNEIINQIIDFIKQKNKTDERYREKNDSNINGLNILYNDFIKILLEI